MFRNSMVKTRLIFSGVVSVISIALLSALGIYSLWQSELELERQIKMTEALRHELKADMMHEAMEALVVYSLLQGEKASATERTKLIKTLEKDIEILRNELDTLAAMDLTPEISALLAKVIPIADQFAKDSQTMQALAFSDNAAGLERLPAFQKQFYDFGDAMAPLAKTIERVAEETAVAARAHDMNLLYMLLGISALTIGMVLYNARRITLTISRPLERLRVSLKEVSQGDFGIKIADRMRSDDFGEIAKDIDFISDRVVQTLAEQEALRTEGEAVINRLGAGMKKLSAGDFSERISTSFNEDYEALRIDFNNTVDNLNDLLSKVVQASNGIQARSGEIHGASQDLSMRTASQAATLEETAAALEQMTNSVKTAAQNTKDVETAMTTAREDVEHSGRVVEGAVEAMNEIEASSSRISQIIGVIDDIAFQTNLLALNAGVEAARAGEVGRGFAVVASEVRSLAQRSSEAANEIKVLISTSTKHVQDGVDQVDQAGKALSAVVTQVAHISELVSGISAVSVEQANGITEVNTGVSQLDQVTQQNATMVEDSGTAIQSLNEETHGLNQLVGQFVLRQDTQAGGFSHSDFPQEQPASLAVEDTMFDTDLDLGEVFPEEVSQFQKSA